MTARHSFSFLREPQSVRIARRALDEFEGQLSSNRMYDASLCLSELVTNAVQHPGAGGELDLTVAIDETRLRVEVADQGGGFNPGPPTKGDERGWGLFIIENLSDSWGVESGERTLVWFEIQLDPDVSDPLADRPESGEQGRGSREDGLLRATALRLGGRLAAP